MTAAPDNTFGHWQQIYAACDIPTFPVRITDGEKRPAIRHCDRVGLRASEQLARGSFANVTAFAFAAGPRSKITVLDVDSADENTFADAVARHGETPLKVRTGSGHYQAWYRHNAEPRLIRPDRNRPVDILGSGCVVAPPSQGSKAAYEIIEGSLDDIPGLPALQNLDAARGQPASWDDMRDGAGRNNHLFRQLAAEAHCCDNYPQLLDRAETLNSQFAEPMTDTRVTGTAKSVWRMTIEGRNRFGQHGAWLPLDDVKSLASDPCAFALLGFLRAHNGPNRDFMVADGLRDTLQWSRRQLADARCRLIEGGWIVRTSAPSPGRAASFVWGPPLAPPGTVAKPRKEAKLRETLVEDSLPKSVGVVRIPKSVGVDGDGAR